MKEQEEENFGLGSEKKDKKKNIVIPVIDRRGQEDTSEPETEGVSSKATHFLGNPEIGSVAKTEEELELATRVNDPSRTRAGSGRCIVEAMTIKATAGIGGIVGSIAPNMGKVCKVIDIAPDAIKAIGMGIKIGDMVLCATNTGHIVRFGSREFLYINEWDVFGMVGVDQE